MTPVPLSVAALHGSVRDFLRGRLDRIRLWGLVALAGTWLVAGWVAASGWDGRRATAVPLVLDLVALAGVLLLLRRVATRGREVLAERRISGAMEQVSGVDDGVIQGVLELERGVPAGVSPALAFRGRDALAPRLARSPGELAGGVGESLTRTLGRTRGVALSVLALGAVLAATAPERAGRAVSTLGTPFAALRGPVLPPLVVEPGSVEVRRDDPVELTIQAPLREAVELRWQAAGDVARRETLPVAGGRAGFRLPRVSAPVTYRVVAPDGASSPEYRLTPVDPLFVTDVTVRLRFPEYTGLPAEEFRGDVPPLSLPEGTRVTLSGRASRELSRASLLRDSTPVLSIPVQGAAFQGSFVPRTGGTFGWSFTDGEGSPAALLPPELVLAVVPDSAPSVAILLPSPDTLLPSNLRQPLVIEAADDYGLQALELVARRVTALGDTLPPVSQSVALGGTRSAVARPVLDVSRWDLVPGDQVRYFARVRDVHPQARSARTPEFVLRMPTPEELRRRAQSRLEGAADRLREMQDEARRAADEARDMERASRAPDRTPREGTESGQRSREGGNFDEQEAVREAVDEQRRLGAAADSLNRDLSELSESLQDAGASDPELAEDIRELQALLEELGGEELQASLDDLMNRMEQGDRRQAAETLEELTARQEAFRERLEEALARAQRAAVEQEFRNATGEAEALARRQEALAETLRDEAGADGEERAGQRAGQQEELAEEAGALQERMDELADRLQELGEEDALRQLNRAEGAARRAEGEMRQAAQQASGGSPQAAQSAQSASESMQEAAREMAEARQQMMSERVEAFQQALQQGARDALSLAREQARTQEAMTGATPETMAELRADVSAVQQGVARMAENLSLAARMAGADDREMSRQMGEAMASLGRTMEALERRGVTRPSPQAASARSIAALNEVAQSALGTLQAMENAGQAGQPSPQELMEQMQQMAQQQAEVNNQAAQMMPMQLTPQAQQQMMEQMAQAQQQIASDLGQMSDQEGEEGPLGDVEAMAAEAEALARQLDGGRLDSETRERQERLFHRLLDAGRSLEKEEETTEREPTAAGEVEAGEIPALEVGDLGLTRFRLPDAATLNRLPPAARALVLRYFERLNRAGTSGSGAGAGQGPAGSGEPGSAAPTGSGGDAGPGAGP